MGFFSTFLRRTFGPPKPAMKLKKGDVAPPFRALDQDGNPVSLSDFAGKRVVLWFYPKADTPGCTKQLCGYRDQFEPYEKKGVVVLGVSFDEPAANKAFAQKFGYRRKLLSDADHKIALAYGAAEKSDDAYARRYSFVIGPDGKIEQAIDTKDAGGQAAELLQRV